MSEAYRLLMALLAWACIALGGCGGGGGEGASAPPPVQAWRTGIYYTYYGTDDRMLDEVRGHVNLWWEWGTGDDAIRRMMIHNGPTVVAVDAALTDYSRPLPVAEREARLRDVFSRLRAANVLHNVVAIYPMDEPDVHQFSDDDVDQICWTVRKIAAEYVELKNVKLAVIYGNQGRPGIANYDWVGSDEYGKGTHAADYIRAFLMPHQRLILVPGGASPWKEDPQPFVRYAENDPRVIAIVNFLWLQYPEDVGIRGNGMGKAYCDAGKQVTTAGAVLSC